jgi:hypothetical protein
VCLLSCNLILCKCVFLYFCKFAYVYFLQFNVGVSVSLISLLQVCFISYKCVFDLYKHVFVVGSFD